MEIKDVSDFQSSLPRRQVTIGVIGIMMSMFISSLYMTVTSTAMPRIITDLGGFSQYTWVFTGFFIAEVMAIPLVGKLSDMYGRKWFFVTGLGIFVFGSLLSGLSQSMTQLIIFRAVQGLGCGAMMSLCFIVIADLFPPAERGKWGGLVSGVMAVSTIIGPTLGGYLTDYLSWRWCFFINIPVGAVVVLLFAFFYPQYRVSSAKHKIDYAGAVVMVLAIASMMLALTWGGVDYPWSSPIIMGLLGFAVIMFALFLLIETRAEEPIMPLELFKGRVVAVSALVVFLMGATFMPAVTFVPLYFQGVLGASASESGNILAPMMLSTSVSSFIAGQLISRTSGNYRMLGTIGFFVMAVGFFLLSQMTPETSYTTAVVNMVITGLGSGLLFPIHTLAVQNTVSYKVLGAATAMITWIRTIGGLIGLSVLGSVVNNRFSSQFTTGLPEGIRGILPAEVLASMVDNPQVLVNEGARAEMLGLFEGLGSKGMALFEQLLFSLQNALNSALTQVFFIIFGGVIIALIANLFLKGIPPYKRDW